MLFKRLFGIAILFFLLTSPLVAQKITKELPTGYYMTVGAYLSTGEGYASRYTNKLIAQGFDADYGFTYTKNMYFVYIKKYDDRSIAIREINSTRKNTPFKDTWVYSYTASNYKEETITPPPPVKTEEINEPLEEDPKVNIVDEDSIAEDVNVTQPIEVEPDLSRLIFFEAREARTQEPVEVEITITDPYENIVLAIMNSEETKKVEPPINDKNLVSVVSNTFGWRKDAVSFNFKDPITDSTDYFLRLSNDTLFLFFDMYRMRRGDIEPLLNVYFFTNSSIIKPISKAELDELLKMMVDNPNMKIKLHGHTNGTSGGPYSRLAENDTIFFKLSKTHKNTNGSAKKLSYDRANTIREYLIHHDISGNRIAVTGWGGKKMIYDENSVAAPRNIRVEVEVIEE